MWKILSTNLLTYNWYNSSTTFDKILSVPKKLKYKITQKKSSYDTSWNTRPWNIITSWITTVSHIMPGMIPELPSWYKWWYLCDSLEEHTDPQTWWLWMDVWYCYSSVPTWFEWYANYSDFHNLQQQFSTILENLWYDYNHWYTITYPDGWWLYNWDIVLAICPMRSVQTWEPIGTTWIFIVTPGGNDTFTITDYFITDMTNSCEYQNASNRWIDMFRDSSSFENFRPSISNSCWVTYDNFVSHLYGNKI